MKKEDYRPEGCFNSVDYKCITRKDINNDRPPDQCSISTERALRHSYLIEKRPKFWPFRKETYWAVMSTTTYEMSGRGHRIDRAWAETDLTGLEWHFYTKNYAENFAYGLT